MSLRHTSKCAGIVIKAKKHGFSFQKLPKIMKSFLEVSPNKYTLSWQYRYSS